MTEYQAGGRIMLTFTIKQPCLGMGSWQAHILGYGEETNYADKETEERNYCEIRDP